MLCPCEIDVRFGGWNGGESCQQERPDTNMIRKYPAEITPKIGEMRLEAGESRREGKNVGFFDEIADLSGGYKKKSPRLLPIRRGLQSQMLMKSYFNITIFFTEVKLPAWIR
jgi:hypothetical protein